MMDELRRELTTMEYVILGLLSREPQTGYAIIQALDNTTQYWRASSGAVYPALRRLEKSGVIQGSVEAIRTMRPRKRYRLTSLGESLLDVWLTAPLTDEELWDQREIPLIKFLFAEQRLSTIEVLVWLDTYERQLNAYHEIHRYWLTAQLSVSSIHQQLLVQATQMELDKQHDWIRLARQRLTTERYAANTHDSAFALA
jgi:DNA-binding PadR family transcriptional regulator